MYLRYGIDLAAMETSAIPSLCEYKGGEFKRWALVSEKSIKGY